MLPYFPFKLSKLQIDYVRIRRYFEQFRKERIDFQYSHSI